MKIGIDIDDTITNTWDCFIPEYSVLFNIPEEKLKVSKPYYESVKHKVTIDEYFKMIVPTYDKVTPNIILKDNVKEVIDKLYELGHTVTFITARGRDHSNPYKVSKDFLDKYGVKYEKIIVNANNKDKVCQEENIDLFIDDSPKHCLSVMNTGIETLCFETYYNKDIKELKHMKNWTEIYEYIKNRW